MRTLKFVQRKTWLYLALFLCLACLSSFKADASQPWAQLWQRFMPSGTTRIAATPARVFNVITVNTTADENGTNNAACSLREAITAANTNAAYGGCPAGTTGTDRIEFNVGTGTPNITVTGSPLPSLTQPVFVEGATGGATRIALDGNGLSIGLDLVAGSGGSTISSLVVKRFSSAGIRIVQSDFNWVRNCFLGTDDSGTSGGAATRNGTGLAVAYSNWTSIGGSTAGEGNVISANYYGGISLTGISGLEVNNTNVYGNIIGADVTGTVALGNGQGNGFGISVSGADNTWIGDGTPDRRNLISGNNGEGIRVGSTTNTRILGNYIGVNAAGTAALGNGTDGIAAGTNNVSLRIGGFYSGDGNVISGNGARGILLQTTNTMVLGNIIGLNAAGAAKIPNLGNGIEFCTAGSGNLIGGTSPEMRNVISGNNGAGIYFGCVNGSGDSGNTVQGNFIGTDITGTLDLGNAGSGIFMGGLSGVSNNIVGGNVLGGSNVIAFNGGAGVGLSTASTRNAIQGNSIFSNVRRGITLDFNNFPANDLGDGDTGANNKQNFPVLTRMAIYSGGRLEGTFNSTANASFRLEFFDSPARHSTGYGEGKTYLGSTNVTTDASGNADFVFYFGLNSTANHFLTATATDANGNTSEFSLSLAPPRVTPQTVAAIPYNSPTRRTIAQVSDFETAAGSLTLDASTMPVGMTVSGLQHDGGGFISALISAACNLAGSTPSFTLHVTDADNNTTSDIITVGVQPLPTIQFTNSNPKNQTVCVGATALFGPINVTFSGGAPMAVNFRWRKVGPLDTVSTTSQLLFANATAEDAGDYVVEYATECNPDNYQLLEQVSLTVNLPAATTALDALNVNAGTAASFTTTASGSGPFNFVWKKGAAVLSSDGHLQINSTATQSTLLIGQTVTGDSDTYSVTVTSACGTVTQSAALTVNATCSGLTLAPLTLSSGVLGYPYSQTLTASGGQSPYSFSLTAGALPPGLSLNTNGTLSGAPTQVGNFVFTVEASAGACTGSAAYTVAIGQLNLAATGGEGYVDLNWTQAGFSSLTGFKLYRATAISGPYTLGQTLAANASTYRDSAVTANTAYFYKLTVLDSNGESSFSNPASATSLAGDAPVIAHTPPSAPTAPGVPITIQATVTDNGGVQSVKLFFRTPGAANYAERILTNSGNNLYQTTIQANEVVVPGVEYYLEARDQSSATLAGQPGNPYRLTLADRPYLTHVSPTSGAATGGTSITLTGHNFKPNAVVRFDNAIATITNQNATQLVCTTPPHFPAVVDVRVTNPDGASDVLTRGFTYQGAQATLSLPTTGGPQGVNVLLPINATNVQGLIAADVRVTFNSPVLQAVNVSLGTLTSGWSIQTNLTTPGEVRLALVSTSGPTGGSGSLAVIEFQVAGAPGAVTPLALNSVLLNGGAIAATLNAGQFTVASAYALSGTVNHWNNAIGGLGNVTLALTGNSTQTVTSQANGAYSLSNVLSGNYTLTPGKNDQTSGISAFDAALVQQHSVGLITLTGAALAAADVDHSGGVNAQDAFYILQQTVGLIGLPFPGAGVTWLFTPATRSYNNLSADQSNQDFTGILLGDVNGSFTTGNAPHTLATLSLPEVSVPAGAEFSTLLNLGLTQGQVLGTDLQLTYDPTVVTPLAVESGSLIGDWLRAVNLNTPGLMRVALAGSRAVTTTGALLRLRWRATGAVGRNSSLTLTLGRLNEGGIGTTLIPGRVTIRSHPALADFDLDGKTDLTVWRGTTGEWLVFPTGNSNFPPIAWGTSNDPYTDMVVPGDYDGDGQTDIAIWRPLDGGWYIISSLTGAVRQHIWGQRGDLPVPSDYDGDGQTDLAVWRPLDNTWYILKSSDGQYFAQAWGNPRAPYSDVAVPADYDGDGKTDLAVFRRQTGTWYVRRSSDGQMFAQAWGAGTDFPVPGDYDGDGQTDFAVWRGAEGKWYVLQSSDGQFQITQWGSASLDDVPVPGDYDGDGRTDVAVFRRSNGVWYIKPTSTPDPPLVKQWGRGTDTPIPGYSLNRN